MQGAQVQSLVGKPRSPKPHAKKKKRCLICLEYLGWTVALSRCDSWGTGLAVKVVFRKSLSRRSGYLPCFLGMNSLSEFLEPSIWAWFLIYQMGSLVRGTETYREIKPLMVKGSEEWVMESQPQSEGCRWQPRGIKSQKRECSKIQLWTLPSLSGLQCCKWYKGPCAKQGKSVAKSGHLKISTHTQDSLFCSCQSLPKLFILPNYTLPLLKALPVTLRRT